MDKFGGLIVLVLFAGGIGFYIYRSYAAMGASGRQRALGLRGHETVAHEWPAELNVPISTGDRVAAAAAGAIAGAMLGGIGVGTTRAPGVAFVLTTTGRLLLRIEEREGKLTDYWFRPTELSLEVIGPGTRKVNGLPSVVVRITSPVRPPLEVLTNDAYVPLLQAWAQRAG